MVTNRRLHRLRSAALGGALLMGAAACSGSSSTATAPAPSTPGVGAGSTADPSSTGRPRSNGVDPNGPEVVEPGDIPDNEAFVTFPAPSGAFSVDVPEGWARTEHGDATTFTDKYNTIEIASTPATAAPTVESVTNDGLTDVSTDPTFNLVSVDDVTRESGDGVVAKYEIGSVPNDVTGKSVVLAVERYLFFQNGTEVVLTLSGAKGADNVDPWKIVTDSLTWT